MTGALILNGDPYNGKIEGGYIVAADGALDKTSATLDLVVGDMDSVKRLPEGINKRIFPRDKDFTDGFAALDVLIEAGAERINVYGALGGRLDHALTNLNMLWRAVQKGIKVVVYTDGETIFPANRGSLLIDGLKQNTVSIVPISDEVHILSTRGLLYPIADEIIPFHTSRLQSNVAAEKEAEIIIASGRCYVIVNLQGR